MPEQFGKVEATLKFRGPSGAVIIEVEGSRVPEDTEKVPGYVAELVKARLHGASSTEVASLKARVVELEKTVEKQIDEIATLKHPPKSNKL